MVAMSWTSEQEFEFGVSVVGTLALVSGINMLLPASNMYIHCTTGTVINSGFSFLATDRTFHACFLLKVHASQLV